MLLLMIAAARYRAQRLNLRPLEVWRTGLCHHGRGALQSCWQCYDEAAFEGAAAIARAS